MEGMRGLFVSGPAAAYFETSTQEDSHLMNETIHQLQYERKQKFLSSKLHILITYACYNKTTLLA